MHWRQGWCHPPVESVVRGRAVPQHVKVISADLITPDGCRTIRGLQPDMREAIHGRLEKPCCDRAGLCSLDTNWPVLGYHLRRDAANAYTCFAFG